MDEKQLQQERTSQVFTIVSFNLKGNAKNNPSQRKNAWTKRKESVCALIRESGASIIGVQELLPVMKQDLKQLLPEYRILGWGRFHRTERRSNEHSDILFRQAELQVRFHKTFWLSKKPDAISRAYFAFFPRICTVAEVTLIQSGQTIRVFNTHLDHICSMARTLAVRTILEVMHQYNSIEPLPTILMGDFNASPKSKPVQILRQHLYPFDEIQLQDVYQHLDIEQVKNTFHGFHGKVKRRGHPIDYVFVSQEFEIEKVQIYTQPIYDRYPSDHYPLIVTLRLPAQRERQAEPQ